MSGFTGNDLKALRRGLVLTNESFAKHLGLKVKLLKKVERLKDKEIPVDNEEFKPLLENICYSVPRMIMIRFQHMQDVQRLLQALASKLEKVDKWLRIEKKRKEKKGEVKGEKEEDEVKEDDEKSERRVSATCVDHRSVK